MTRRNWLVGLLLVFLAFSAAGAQEKARGARIKDITTVEGVRDNPLVGYGMVVGLNGTGDRRQTLFSTQTLANILQRMGVQVPASAVRVNNVAAVFVTATLPPFARPGMRVDVTVSSIGDAKTLEGGMLLLTPLLAADGRVYVIAQGPLILGGYSAGLRGNSRQVNHPTMGRIPDGGIVEREVSVNLRQLSSVSLLLREPDFATARDVAAAINRELAKESAKAVDSRRVEITEIATAVDAVPQLLARVGSLQVTVRRSAKVVVNERTGTIVLGRDVTLGPCAILHGNLAIEISTDYLVSQPEPLSKGQTAVVPQTDVSVKETPAQTFQLREGATVEDLVRGLHAIGATARDIVAILQAIKAAGALDAELEVL
jgi:flagellar P-ring protein precursor FlgI